MGVADHVRLSLGNENTDDLIAHLEPALATAYSHAGCSSFGSTR
jgi:hypothetical protein